MGVFFLDYEKMRTQTIQLNCMALNPCSDTIFVTLNKLYMETEAQNLYEKWDK